jgi:tetratricopeptide (TPR) repeat protein
VDSDVVEAQARIEILKRHIEQEPLKPQPYLDLARVYLDDGRPDVALAEYQKALALDPGCTEAVFQSGRLYLLNEEYDKAEAAFNRALLLDPTLNLARSGLFRIYYARGDLDRALPLGEDMLKTGTQELEFHKLMFDGYSRKSLPDKAFAELQTLVRLAPEDVGYQRDLARYYDARGESEKALECYRKALELEPDNSKTRLWLVRRAYGLQEYLEVTALAEPVADDADPRSRIGAVFGYYLGVALYRTDKVERSRAVLDRTLEPDLDRLEPEDRPAIAELFFLHGQEAKSKEGLSVAIALIKQALRYTPANPEYRQELELLSGEEAKIANRRHRRNLKVAAVVAGSVAVVVLAWVFTHGRVTLSGTGLDQAAITLDGRTGLSATATRDGLRFRRSLWVGNHTVRVQRDGYEPWERVLTIAPAGSAAFQPELVPIYGFIRVMSTPYRVTVNCDGKAIGQTPLAAARLLATRHNLEVRETGWRPWSTTVTVRRDETLSVPRIVLTGTRRIFVTEYGGYYPLYTVNGRTYELGYNNPVFDSLPPRIIEFSVWNKDAKRGATSAIDLEHNEAATLSVNTSYWGNVIDNVKYVKANFKYANRIVNCAKQPLVIP